MSTFNGIIHEFPDIRIDYFRHVAGTSPPLACFLSHVHSDHLAGLESLRSPFVYCSAATREILLRLERYPCRINYAKGILEARQQSYRHLKTLLKPLPLDTAVQLELQPGLQIQVTLLDANHCPGAVMFLIEEDRRAILYTGDIRSEPWFVSSLTRHPALLEYTSHIKTLDCIYLDTSFITDIPFQTKAEGLAELLSKVAMYPSDTTFHLKAWTYGYEDVWIALAKSLGSKIHVDEYKMNIYRSLRKRSSDQKTMPDAYLVPEAASLLGFYSGNNSREGCLTANTDVRIHSCEKGNMCDVARNPRVVTLQPIIAHLPNGQDMMEMGIGGGGDDLKREAELDMLSPADLQHFLETILSMEDLPLSTRDEVHKIITETVTSGRHLNLSLDISTFGDNFVTDLRSALQSLVTSSTTPATTTSKATSQGLPKTIRFPYSRHSSFPELCHMTALFKPRDVWPCTVDPEEWGRHNITIESLFGTCCEGKTFRYDKMLARMAHSESQLYCKSSPVIETQRASCPSPVLVSSPAQRSPHETHASMSTQDSRGRSKDGPLQLDMILDKSKAVQTLLPDANARSSSDRHARSACPKRSRIDFEDDQDCDAVDSHAAMDARKSFVSGPSPQLSDIRQEAYWYALNCVVGDQDWVQVPLISVNDGHTAPETDIGN